MATVTREQFDLAFIRRSQEDHKLILNALEADGTLTVMEGDEIIDPPALLDAEGNEVKDADGNTVLEAPAPQVASDAIEIEVENTDEEEEAEEG